MPKKIAKEMLQRKQTIFMFIAILVMIVLLVETKDFVQGHSLVFVGSAVVVFLQCLALFSFKNRKRQILLNIISIIINALLISFSVYCLLTLPGGFSFPEKGIELIFFSLSIIWLLIANHFIRKDERLVKSVDRLR